MSYIGFLTFLSAKKDAANPLREAYFKAETALEGFWYGRRRAILPEKLLIADRRWGSFWRLLQCRLLLCELILICSLKLKVITNKVTRHGCFFFQKKMLIYLKFLSLENKETDSMEDANLYRYSLVAKQTLRWIFIPYWN